MSVATKNRKARIGDKYLALVLEHPLKAIKTRTDYIAATAVLDKLAIREKLDPGEEQYLETLEVLITAYDDKHAPEVPDDRQPLERLRAMMELSATTPARLREILGSSQSMVSMILNGQRELSKKVIIRLADHFKLDPGYFF